MFEMTSGKVYYSLCTMIMNNLPDMFTDTFPDYLITTIVMFNNRPCSDLITQAAKDEYDDETRGVLV